MKFKRKRERKTTNAQYFYCYLNHVILQHEHHFPQALDESLVALAAVVQ